MHEEMHPAERATYPLSAGVALILSAAFLMRGDATAAWLCALFFVFTLAWVLIERGLSGWPQVPRLVSPGAMLALVLIALPRLERRPRRGGGYAVLAIAILGLAVPARGSGVWGGEAYPFMFRTNGRQVVGPVAGGRRFTETTVADYDLVWALPQ